MAKQVSRLLRARQIHRAITIEPRPEWTEPIDTKAVSLARRLLSLQPQLLRAWEQQVFKEQKEKSEQGNGKNKQQELEVVINHILERVDEEKWPSAWETDPRRLRDFLVEFKTWEGLVGQLEMALQIAGDNDVDDYGHGDVSLHDDNRMPIVSILPTLSAPIPTSSKTRMNTSGTHVTCQAEHKPNTGLDTTARTSGITTTTTISSTSSHDKQLDGDVRQSPNTNNNIPTKLPQGQRQQLRRAKRALWRAIRNLNSEPEEE
ncbi:hypothetical protein F5Y12DRAFT_792251 [Xylaria sp. FL1777]|nr:hypothetical protein F5Y12DRAFT_792251 [Xylaria sp. FL1777]